MKESIRLNIAQPCHENWQAMTPVEQGRHCGSCAKNVVDFTIMSDREIIDYISLHASGDTCGRVNNDQLSRVIQKPGERSVSWKYFWSLALSSLLLSYRSMAQQHPPKSKAAYKNTGLFNREEVQVMGLMAIRPPAPPEFQIRGRVVNEDGQPVPYASVNLEKPGRLVVADSAGRFTIDVQNMDAIELSASAAGYEPLAPVSFDVDPIAVKSKQIKNKRVVMEVGDLELKKKVLKEVVVIGYPTVGKLSITGAVSYVRADTFVTHVDTIVNKIQKTINKITGRSEIKNSGAVKVYPNPAPAGGHFFVQFNIKEAGEYNVQFIDALGRIVAGKPLVIATPGQVEAFPAAALQGHGIYFIRVAGAKDGKLYNARLEIL